MERDEWLKLVGTFFKCKNLGREVEETVFQIIDYKEKECHSFLVKAAEGEPKDAEWIDAQTTLFNLNNKIWIEIPAYNTSLWKAMNNQED